MVEGAVETEAVLRLVAVEAEPPERVVVVMRLVAVVVRARRASLSEMAVAALEMCDAESGIACSTAESPCAPPAPPPCILRRGAPSTADLSANASSLGEPPSEPDEAKGSAAPPSAPGRGASHEQATSRESRTSPSSYRCSCCPCWPLRSRCPRQCRRRWCCSSRVARGSARRGRPAASARRRRRRTRHARRRGRRRGSSPPPPDWPGASSRAPGFLGRRRQARCRAVRWTTTTTPPPRRDHSSTPPPPCTGRGRCDASGRRSRRPRAPAA